MPNSKKDQWMAGGAIDYLGNHSENNVSGLNSDTKIHNLEISPGLGFFIIDRLCAGIRVAFFDSRTKIRTEGLNSFAISTSEYDSKYYLLPAKNRWNVFGEAGYAYMKERTKTTVVQLSVPLSGGPGTSGSTSMTKTDIMRHCYSVAAGPVFFISPQVSLELAAGFTLGKVNGENNTSNQLSVGTGFQVFFLGKK